MARTNGIPDGVGKALVALAAAGAGVVTVVSARRLRPLTNLRARRPRGPRVLGPGPERAQIGSGRSAGPDVEQEVPMAGTPTDDQPGSSPAPSPRSGRAPGGNNGLAADDRPTASDDAPATIRPVDEGEWATASYPLGAHAVAAGTSASGSSAAGASASGSSTSGSSTSRTSPTTFAVHAPAATRVLLEIYPSATGTDASVEVDTHRGHDGIWRARVEGAGHGTLYGYRVWGPGFEPHEDWSRGGSAAGFSADHDEVGNRFNPNKVLLDPYAREITHNLSSSLIEAEGGTPEDFAGGPDTHAQHGRPRREVDTGRIAPKGIVVVDETSFGTHPHLLSEGTSIYEGHTHAMTAHPSVTTLGDDLAGRRGFSGVRNVDDEARGTYKGVGQLAPYLKGLGLTTLELLPVQATDTTARPGDDGTSNYWGYMTLAFFAPNRDLACDTSPGGPTREFKEMARALHEQGIELYIDVVYNHTGEGGSWGGDPATSAFVSLGGFATAEYYVQTDDHVLVDGATGTGNQVNFSSEASQRLVLDSLAYWTDVMGVDGFRFDLAPVLGRAPEDSAREDWEGQKEFYPLHPLLTSIRDLAADRRIEVIAEAWDLWGYEVGNFPAGWGEWNGRFRDAVRDFLRGEGSTMAFVEQVNGDWPHFHDQGGPARSINFVTAHDGFTMLDLVSYNDKVNDGEPPFGPSDGGSDDNRSWDSGGDQALRRARLRSFLTVLFLARGVPMIVAGDELGRTQNGNNNPWSLNSVGMWTNYGFATSNRPTQLPVDPTGQVEAAYHDNVGEAATPEGTSPFLPFAQALAHLRRVEPALRQREWGGVHLDDGDVSYLFGSPDASRGTQAGDRAVRVHIDGSPVGGHDYLMCVNMTTDVVDFALGQEHDGLRWHRVVDTAPWAEEQGNVWPTAVAEVVEGDYAVQPWTVAVLQLA
ncbi:alpha-amylase family glycosyl hydrolase [Georgenia sp. Z1491]|uniref:alpha-amylase family glycosyl hydrolase n=1 Tax=Georgenia sp. Z1491 TaxID=3416707 RepID=UPI003CEF9EE4